MHHHKEITHEMIQRDEKGTIIYSGLINRTWCVHNWITILQPNYPTNWRMEEQTNQYLAEKSPIGYHIFSSIALKFESI